MNANATVAAVLIPVTSIVNKSTHSPKQKAHNNAVILECPTGSSNINNTYMHGCTYVVKGSLVKIKLCSKTIITKIKSRRREELFIIKRG
jgi:hypothetical protein